MKKVLGLLMTLSLATGFNVFADTPKNAVKDACQAVKKALDENYVKDAKGKNDSATAVKHITDKITAMINDQKVAYTSKFKTALTAIKTAANNDNKTEADATKTVDGFMTRLAGVIKTQIDETGLASLNAVTIELNKVPEKDPKKSAVMLAKEKTSANDALVTIKASVDTITQGEEQKGEKEVSGALDTLEAAVTKEVADTVKAKTDKGQAVDAIMYIFDFNQRKISSDLKWYERAMESSREFWKNRTTWERRGIVAGGAALGATALIGTLYATGVLHKLWYKGFSRPAPADQIAAAGYALREVKNNPEETAKLHYAFVNSYGEHNWTRVVQFEANIDKAK